MADIVINIKGTRLEIDTKIKLYLNKRLNALKKFVHAKKTDKVIFDVELARRNQKQNKGADLYKAEINVSIHGNRLRAVSHQADIFTAIDDAKEEIEKELIVNKEKTIEKIRKGARKVKKIIREE